MRERLAVLLAVLACLAAAAPATARAAPAFTDGDGLQVAGVREVRERLWDVKVRTDALARPVDVRILLPEGYGAAAARKRRYPVLYLLHGTSGRAADWTTTGDAERATAGRPLIVVMPDAGYDGDGGGWFTDWFNAGAGGLPKWETFHMRQLVPWVDRVLRTVADRRGRAIYGLSQGGFGALSYAARHPDRFVAAGAYSGAVETSADPQAAALVTPIVQGTSLGLNGTPPDAMFGPRLTQEVNWRAHDPATLAANLRGMDLRLYTGNGRPGPLDPAAPNPASTAIEAGVHQLNELFHGHLERLGIPSAYRYYGPGTHTWGYWARSLRDTIGPLMEEFADPRRAPARISYRSGENRWAAWGWDVELRRPAREFSALRDADAGGFTLSGSGAAAVRTPPFYAPGSPAAVRLHGDTVDATRHVRADGGGRLALGVPLGPGNAHQQYTVPATLTGTKVFTTRVRIDGVARRKAGRRKAARRKACRKPARPAHVVTRTRRCP